MINGSSFVISFGYTVLPVYEVGGEERGGEGRRGEERRGEGKRGEERGGEGREGD